MTTVRHPGGQRFQVALDPADAAAAVGEQGMVHWAQVAQPESKPLPGIREQVGAQLSPSDFVLIDANGVEYAPESLASAAYLGNDNPQSPFAWPDSFPVGRATSVAVIFDISPTLPRGMQLKVSDLQNTRVTLD